MPRQRDCHLRIMICDRASKKT